MHGAISPLCHMPLYCSDYLSRGRPHLNFHRSLLRGSKMDLSVSSCRPYELLFLCFSSVCPREYLESAPRQTTAAAVCCPMPERHQGTGAGCTCNTVFVVCNGISHVCATRLLDSASVTSCHSQRSSLSVYISMHFGKRR
jgi:hypothetical protein